MSNSTLQRLYFNPVRSFIWALCEENLWSLDSGLVSCRWRISHRVFDFLSLAPRSYGELWHEQDWVSERRTLLSPMRGLSHPREMENHQEYRSTLLPFHDFECASLLLWRREMDLDAEETLLVLYATHPLGCSQEWLFLRHFFLASFSRVWVLLFTPGLLYSSLEQWEYLMVLQFLRIYSYSSQDRVYCLPYWKVLLGVLMARYRSVRWL